MLAFVAPLLVLAPPLAETEDGARWPQFRGPNGGGVTLDAEPLPTALKPEQALWKQSLPLGHSSPCIWGDKVFVTGATDRDVQTFCLDRNTGEVLWVQKALTDTFERRHRINSSATPTATTDGERVFVYFGSCGLMAYDFAGEEVWLRRMRIPDNGYGVATSPILAGGRLVFLSDNATGSFLESIDAATGETVWKQDRADFIAGWSTPLYWENDGVHEIVVNGAGWITAYGATDGSERWALPGMTYEPSTTPVFGEGILFATSYNMRTNPEVIGLPEFGTLLEEYDTDEDGLLTFKEIRPNKSILSRNDADGEGDHPLPGFFRFLDQDRNGELTAEEWGRMHAWLDNFDYANALMAIRPGDSETDSEIVWQHNRGVPECPSPLYFEGRVYMVKNGGIVTCVNAMSGELLFEGRLGAGGPYYASPVAGDGKVYLSSARGTVTVLAAGDTLEVLARNDIGERLMATPALVDGTLYLRTEGHLFAFGKRDE